MKRCFKFKLPDGSVETNTEASYLSSLGMTAEFIERRQQQERAHLNSESFHEREWRDSELASTDKLMFMDSTYQGKPVAGSDMYDQIVQYRQELRDYDPVLQDRPNRPDWFFG